MPHLGRVATVAPKRWLRRGRGGLPGAAFERLFDGAAVGMMILTPELTILRVNGAVCALLDRGPSELVGRSVLDFTHPEDVDRSVDWTAAKIAGASEPPLFKRYIRPDGSIVEATVASVLIDSRHGARCLFSQLQDVTEQRRAERQKDAIVELGRRALDCPDVLTLMGEAMRLAMETLQSANCITNRRLADGEVRNVATAGDVIESSIGAGDSSQTEYTLRVSDPVISNDLARDDRFSVPARVLRSGLGRGISVRVPERAGDRHVLLAQRRASDRPFVDQDVRFLEAFGYVIGSALDRAASEEELRRRALEDPLTGLANRALLANHLEGELRHARRLGVPVCLFALDLDRFKTVNDALGHTAGDALLQRVAARLRGCVREEDLLARHGGDEFAVICARADSDHAIVEVAQRLVDAIAAPFEINGREVFVTASVGVAVSERGEETPEELLRDVDAAMYRAKELGGGRYETFDVSLRARLMERMAIEADLRHAVDQQQFHLEYQPVVDLSCDRIAGFEALLRWDHPERGRIGPDTFIPIAEETGLIIPIGSWVLRRACAQLAAWPHEIKISANLSPLQIRAGLVPEVQALLREFSLEPGRLILEITESAVLDPAVKPIVTGLRALGVPLALDDFGVGYSSLGSLQRFPLDVVKLDHSLCASLSESRAVAVVRAALELGQALGVGVVAEGIETDEQLAILRELGCGLGQGFLFARPMRMEQAELLLAEPGLRLRAVSS